MEKEYKVGDRVYLRSDFLSKDFFHGNIKGIIDGYFWKKYLIRYTVNYSGFNGHYNYDKTTMVNSWNIICKN